MKKKKIVKKYNKLAIEYNELLNMQEALELSFAQMQSEKEDIANAFLETTRQCRNLTLQLNEMKRERDMYRKNYGELVSIATKASEQGDNAISIKNIDFSEDVTTVTWSDDVTTSVKRMKGEKHDTHTAIAYAIAKRVLGTTSIADVVKFYKEDHSKDAKYARIYRHLGSKNPKQRAKAQKAWDKIPESKRQSIKAMVKKCQ